LLQLLRASQGAVLVGGQALAFWIARFRIDISRGPRPYVSADVDFLGFREHVAAFAAAIRGAAVYPPKRGSTALQGVVTKKSARGGGVEVDVLHKIVGLDANAVRRRALEVTHPRDATLRFLVMDPVDCLASRIENLRQLADKKDDVSVWQAEKAILVCRAYVSELIREASEHKAIKVATALFGLAGSAAGLQAHARYGLDLLEAIPLDEFSGGNFLEQQARRSIAAIQTLRSGKAATRGSS
jgi:hypothetical protein